MTDRVDFLYALGLTCGIAFMVLIVLAAVFNSNAIALSAACCFGIYVLIGMFISITRRDDGVKS